MRIVRGLKILLPAFGLLASIPALAGLTFSQKGDLEYVPTGKGWGVYSSSAPKGSVPSKKTSNGIVYHGGPVMLGQNNVYYIWYGNWSGNTATSILPGLASTIGGTPYFNINHTYYDAYLRPVANIVNLSGQIYDPSESLGNALSDANVQSIVTNALASGQLPVDSHGVYFVLTSADVNETSGFCTQYCGWHTHTNFNGVDIKYSFVGNPDRCPSSCEAQSASSPNNNPGADGMASVIAHELSEAVTDPDLNAWYDNLGRENADKCAWKFGTTYTTSNGSLANVNFAGVDYLIQQNWVNAGGGYCSMSY